MKQKKQAVKESEFAAPGPETEQKLRVLAIIPAREGSKGIKDKNVATCEGRPLIAWTIEAARKAGNIDRLIVSTDSQRYKEMLEHDYGKDLFPFLRPEKFADDKAPSSDVIIHALDRLIELGEEPFDIVVLLEPTSPLRTAEQINEAIQILKQSQKARAIVSIVESPSHHPLLAFEIDKSGKMFPYGQEHNKEYPGHPRRQALRPAYFMSGDLYLSYVDTYRERLSFNHDLTAGYIVQSWQGDEVDEPVDLIRVSAILHAKREGKL